MIGYRAVLTPGSERYVHHMMLYECHDDRGDSYSRFNHHVNSGYECHAPNMPVDFKVCRRLTLTSDLVILITIFHFHHSAAEASSPRGALVGSPSTSPRRPAIPWVRSMAAPLTTCLRSVKA